MTPTAPSLDVPQSPAPGPLCSDGRWLRDAEGRAVVLRGVNLSGRHKLPPHTLPATEAVLGPLRDWGLSVVRLVLVWEAIEPEPDRYDEVYLDRIEALVQALGERGLHVIADMHQDIYSRAFGGSGAPAWSIAPADRRPAGGPDPTWFLRYANWDEVRRSLGRFFRDEDGLQGHFIRSLVHAARRLRRHRAVVGCELFNEPFPGDLPLDRFEVERLAPFYRRAITAVRDVAPGWLILFEGTVLASEEGTALDGEALGGAAGLVYAPHFYDKLAFLTKRYEGDHREMDRVLHTYAQDAARLGVPWLLGEYGIPLATGGAAAYLRDQEQALARHLVGGTFWHYDPTGEDWNCEGMSAVGASGEETALVPVLARPYPLRVAGDLIEHGFDDERRRFRLRLRPRGDSLVYLPRRHYGEDPDRVAVRLEGGPDLGFGLDLGRQILVLRAPAGTAEVTLEVTPAS